MTRALVCVSSLARSLGACFHAPRPVPAAGRDALAAVSIRNPGQATCTADFTTPYYSSKRDHTVHLNRKVRVGVDCIGCKHLGVLWENSFHAGNGKPDYRYVSNEQELQSHVPTNIDTLISDRDRAQAEFVDNPAWGRRIADDFKDMDAAGQTHRTRQVNSTNHTMALGLRKKDKGGEPSYVVKFYDPNRTATHQRTQASTPEAFSSLTASDFLVPRKLALYDMVENSGAVLFLGERMAGYQQQPVRIDRADAATLNKLMCYGLVAGLHSFFEMLRAHQLDQRALPALLAAETAIAPGLFLAMQNGRAGAVRLWGDFLLGCDELDTDTRARLLACAHDGNGRHGLMMAMHNNNCRVIRVWGDIVLRCGLTLPQLAELLEARLANGMPCLHIAMKLDCADALFAYGELLCAPGIPPALRVDLLAVRDDDGSSALQVALRHNRARALLAFAGIVEMSGLEPEQRTRLLDVALECIPTREVATAHPVTGQAFLEVLRALGH